MPLSGLRPSQVKAWTAKLAAGGMEASYVYALHSRLRRSSRTLCMMAFSGVIPARGGPRRRSGSPRYVATTAQVWAVHDAVPDHLKAAVLLGASAGLRVAEVAALRVIDVDFIRGVVHPKQQWPDKPLKTPGSEQAIPIPRDLSLLLSASVKTYPSEMMVTSGPGTDRCGPWIIERAIRDTRDKIDGLPEGLSFHDLRHYLASLLIASGADTKTVQARMRPATARTTLDTYGHLWPDADESTRSAVGAVIAERLKSPADQLRTQSRNG